MKKTSLKARILSLLTVFVMVFTTIPVTGLADPLVSFAASGGAHTIDYGAETITFNTATHEMNTASDWSGTSIAPGGSISSYINPSTETPIILYLREKANNTVTNVTIPVRPAGPTDGAQRDVSGELKSVSVGRNSVKAGEEYSLDNWVTKNDTGSFANLENNEEYTVKLRKKATASAFASDSGSMKAVRTKIEIKPPVAPGDGNEIIIRNSYLTNGATSGSLIQFDTTFSKAKRPILKIQERPDKEVQFHSQSSQGQWKYQYRTTPDDKEITFEMTLADKQILGASGGVWDRVHADNPRNTSTQGITELGNNEIPMQLSYDNGTYDLGPVTYDFKSGTFNPKGGSYQLQANSVVDWPAWKPEPTLGWPTVSLIIKPVTANVPASIPAKNVPVKVGGYASHAEMGLPDKVTVTYTGDKYTTRTEEVSCTWSPVVGGFGSSAGSRTFTATPSLPTWATRGTTTTTTVTVNAQATAPPLTYGVNYDANGGTGAPAAGVKQPGVALTLSATAPTRAGYTFKDWNTSRDGSGTSYRPGASYNTDANVTLYAQWDQIITPVTDITGVPANAEVNKPLNLTGTVAPANATNKDITWSVKSAGSTGATITRSTFTATAQGTAIVTATIAKGTSASANYTKDFNIVVTPPFVAVTGITGVPTEATVNTDLNLTGTVVPSNATNKTITWAVKSAGSTGATITGNAFRATAVGKATITATVAGGATASTAYTKDFIIDVEPAPVAVNFTTLTANGNATTTTTELTVTLNTSVTGLALSDFTVTGAVVNNLNTSAAPTYKLTVSDILVNNGQKVTVAVGKKGYIFTPGNKEVTVNKMIKGRVSIAGDLKYGSELRATASGVANTSTLAYEWKRGNATVGRSNKYTVQAGDIGQTLTCQVTSSTEGGAISATTGVITKADAAQPKVNFSFDGPKANQLVGATAGMEYSLDGGTVYTVCTPDVDLTPALSSITEANDIRVRTKATATHNLSDALRIDIVRGGEVTGVILTHCTTSKNNDGTIIGLTPEMEYKPKDATDWIIGTGSTITALTNGTYQIRTRMQGTTLTGPTSETVIEEYKAPQLPPQIEEGIKNNIVQINRGDGSNKRPVEIEFKETEKKAADEYLAGIEGLDIEVLSVVDDGVFTMATVKVNNASSASIGEVQAFAKELVVVLKVANSHTEVLQSVKEFLKRNPIPQPHAAYLDVKEGDWFYDAVNYVTSHGIMTGYQQGTFGPADSLGRGQFATILYRMEGSPAVGFENLFSDVPAGQFYSLPVVWANKKNIITGYENRQFGPSDSMTREQLATILYRHTVISGGDVSARADIGRFPDAHKVTAFAREAISWAVARGIITGDQGNLNPQGISSRAVTATVIQRLQTK